jgi:thiosulfate/3-mercaptopyruvate sulfurtransferase
MRSKLALIIEAEELQHHLADDNLVVIDVSIPQVYKEGHVPGAIHLSYPSIVDAHDDVDCDIPSDEDLSAALSKLGISPGHHIVAYDAQHNPMACRLLWTLEELGHKNYSIMNGGWHAWRDGGYPVETQVNVLPESGYSAKQKGIVNAKREYIESKLNDPAVVILDTRMHEEFTNELLITDRGGNIPGAVHYDWMNSVDEEKNYRFFSDEILLNRFYELGVVPEKEIIVYCQTHFRSAHTYILLKHLGFEKVKAYAAGYSEWGNALDTVIENEACSMNGH